MKLREFETGTLWGPPPVRNKYFYQVEAQRRYLCLAFLLQTWQSSRPGYHPYVLCFPIFGPLGVVFIGN